MQQSNAFNGGESLQRDSTFEGFSFVNKSSLLHSGLPLPHQQQQQLQQQQQQQQQQQRPQRTMIDHLEGKSNFN
jgi:hypothetical protein